MSMTESYDVSLSQHYRLTRPVAGVEMKKRKLVHGVGINDADYETGGSNAGLCPCYATWAGMMRRCYSNQKKTRLSAYVDCSVSESWRSFMAFRSWWIANHKDGWHLDKDLLIYGNKVYGPETCVFVPQEINNFIVKGRSASSLPIGVSTYRDGVRFLAQCRTGNGGKSHIGLFDCVESASAAYIKAKIRRLEALRPIMDAIDRRIYLSCIKHIEQAGMGVKS